MKFQVKAVVSTKIQGKSRFTDEVVTLNCEKVSEMVAHLVEEGHLNGSDEEMWRVHKDGVLKIAWMEYGYDGFPCGYSRQTVRIYANGSEVSRHYPAVAQMLNDEFNM